MKNKVQSIFSAKIKLVIWSVNAILLLGIVCMGIEQAGKGAEIVHFENEIKEYEMEKQKLSDNIFDHGNMVKNEEYVAGLNFSKPSKVYYLNPEESLAKLPTQ